MLFEELRIKITGSSDVEFLNSHRTSTPAWLIRLACAAHAGAASLAECRDLCEWFGVERRRATIHHWYQAYAEHYDQEFAAEPDCIAVDEKQIQLENGQRAWLSAAIDVDTKVMLHVRLSWHRGRDPAEEFLTELKEKHRVSDAEFFVDGMGYLTALARTDLSGELNYTDRNIVEKLFQTYTMLLTLPMVFKRDKKRPLSVVAECLFGRSGTLQTACEGKSPAESGIPVPTSGINSDTETGSPVLNKQGAGSPERGRSG